MKRQRTLTLSNDQREELIDHRDHDPRPDMRVRCAAILKIADGKSPYRVAREGLLKPHHPDTVYGWLNHYEEGGLDQLLEHRHGGNRYAPF